ncbi:MAG: hypothetical protein U0414_19175 [Polyangiaceae bacterium]
MSLAKRLQDSGIIRPLQQDNRDVALTWDKAQADFSMGPTELVALPDMHLAGAGPGDVFAAVSADKVRARLLAFVRALADARAAGEAFEIVQLGDLYDVWRAYPHFKDHPTSDYRVIEKAYGESLAILLQDLTARVCIGNHDAALALFPPSWARSPAGGVNGQLAYGHRFGGGTILAFHGHQEETLAQAMAAQGGSAVVKLVTEAAKLSNPLSFAIQNGFDFLSDLFSDNEFSLNDLLETRWPGVDPPADAHGFASPRWSAREGREILQKLVSALPGAHALRLVVLGHSHRPGVSAIHVEGRLVPLVDVGSWVQGRAQIAIARDGELRLWSVV